MGCTNILIIGHRRLLRRHFITAEQIIQIHYFRSKKGRGDISYVGDIVMIWYNTNIYLYDGDG